MFEKWNRKRPIEREAKYHKFIALLGVKSLRDERAFFILHR